MHHFLLTTKQKWRLFWTLETIGISFWLAIVGVLYIGGISREDPLITQGGFSGAKYMDFFPPYFVFAFTPGTVTVLSFVLNALVWNLSNNYGAGINFSDGLASTSAMGNSGGGGGGVGWLWWCICYLYSFVVKAPVFATGLTVWHVFSILLGATLTSKDVLSGDSDYKDDHLLVSSALVALACFAVGLAAFAVTEIFDDGDHTFRRSRRWCILFVGWGVGAAAGVALIVPTASSKYYALPGGLCSFCVGVYSFADGDSLGPWVGKQIQPAVAVLQNRDGLIHWAVMSCMQMLMVSWATRLYLYIRYAVIE